MDLFIGPLGTLSFFTLSFCILLDAIMGLLFLFRKSANKRSDYFFSGLLFAFALTALHHIFILQGVYVERPELLFLPIYFTLSFGTMFFYAVKLHLFPAYKFVGSDAKHFFLPVGQFLYFLGLFLFTSVLYREEVGRKFYSPFYGGLEMAFYIATFYAYLFGAYRYIRFKIASLRNDESLPEVQKALLLRRFVRVMVILFWINSAYIVADFAMYELLRLNMHQFRGFTRAGEFSFAALALWTGWNGWLFLTKHKYQSVSGTALSFLKKMLAHKR